MTNDKLTETIAKSLRVLHAACLKYRSQFDPNDSYQVGTYVFAVKQFNVTPEAVEAATAQAVVDLTEWPSAGTYAKLVADKQYELFRARVATFVRAVNDEGDEVMAAPERVRHGRLLPQGDMTGDGSAAPALRGRPTKRGRELARALTIGSSGSGRGGIRRAREV